MTSKVKNLQLLSTLVQSSFPQKKQELPLELQQYWQSRSGLSVSDGVLLYNGRTVIPPPARNRVLQVLHSAHQGVTGMSLCAEQSVFWPGMREDIKRVRAACRLCDTIAPSQDNMPPCPPISRITHSNTSAVTTSSSMALRMSQWWTGSATCSTSTLGSVEPPPWLVS